MPPTGNDDADQDWAEAKMIAPGWFRQANSALDVCQVDGKPNPSWTATILIRRAVLPGSLTKPVDCCGHNADCKHNTTRAAFCQDNAKNGFGLPEIGSRPRCQGDNQETTSLCLSTMSQPRLNGALHNSTAFTWHLQPMLDRQRQLLGKGVCVVE